MRLPAIVLGFAIAPVLVHAPGHQYRGPEFEEVTSTIAVNDGGHSFSGSWGDPDGDGDLDLFVANGFGDPDFFYLNDGNFNFTKVQDSEIVALNRNSSSGRWVDYDDDGDLDMLVAVLSGSVLQYRNDGAAGFARVTESVIARLGANSRKIGPADYDNDGDIDLLISQRNGADNLLLQNRGDGSFEPVTDSDVVNDGGNSTCVEWADVDDDGDLDVFICNSGEPNFLYRNDGAGQFERIISGDIVTDIGRTGGGSWADFDGDGDLDLFTSNVANQDNILYRYDGDWSFTRIDTGIHVDDGGESNATTAVDVDNDGDQDLFIANVGGRNDLYLNDGRGEFAKVFDGPLVEADRVSASASWADIDRDGDLDVFISNLTSGSGSADNQLFRNETVGNHWLHMRLVGTSSNSSGIGARVRLKATVNGESNWQLRELTAGVGNATSGLELAYGLADASMADSIFIRWPVGTVQVLTDVASDQLLRVAEPRVDLDHDPVSRSGQYRPVPITFSLTDETGSLLDVVVRYRESGAVGYATLVPAAGPGGAYSATIPAPAGDLEYYIEARFERFQRFHGTAANPHRIRVFPLPEPAIRSVLDVPNDQGGRVSVLWYASARDSGAVALPFYSIWRALPGDSLRVSSAVTPGSRGSEMIHRGLSWEWLSNQPALQLESYAYTAETLFDRSETTDGIHYFMVVAHTDDPDVFFLSEPVSGYSEGPPPTEYELRGNYPNPFSGTTTITFVLPGPAEVSLIVYDLLGRPVRRLASGGRAVGHHRVVFDAGDLPAGIYPYVLRAGSFVRSRTMTIVK